MIRPPDTRVLSKTIQPAVAAASATTVQRIQPGSSSIMPAIVWARARRARRRLRWPRYSCACVAVTEWLPTHG